MSEINNCPICNSGIHSTHSDERLMYSYNCKVCGSVKITEEGLDIVLNNIGDKKYLLSGICRERLMRKLPPIEIRTINAKELVDGVSLNINQKIDKLISYLELKSSFYGDDINMDWRTDYPITYSKNDDEFIFLIKLLLNQNIIEGSADTSGYSVHLSYKGWIQISEANKSKRLNGQVFIAMWFDNDLKNVFINGISKAVTDCGYSPLRIDLIQHNDKIDDRIISEIKKSDFLIADFTGHRGGVYFEAGFAMGLGIPIIWTCREDCIDEVHFDTRQYNHIVWKDENDIYEKIVRECK